MMRKRQIPLRIINRLVRGLHENLIFGKKSSGDTFLSIYKHNYWGDTESVSGPGSTLKYTDHIRTEIPKILSRFQVTSMIDAPCGDMNWMSHILNTYPISYIGGDIVPDLIVRNRRDFENPSTEFANFDVTKDKFPNVDLWLCRALFFHLSNREIYLALSNFANSQIKYMLVTNHSTEDDFVNIDIATGDWRLLDLMKSPFNFPRTFLAEIDYFIEPFPPSTLTLWPREQIAKLLPSLKSALDL